MNVWAQPWRPMAFYSMHLCFPNAPPSCFGKKLKWASLSPLTILLSSPYLLVYAPCLEFFRLWGSNSPFPCCYTHTPAMKFRWRIGLNNPFPFLLPAPPIFWICLWDKKTALGSSWSPLIQFCFTLPFSIHTSILIVFFLYSLNCFCAM